jgi:hypothetical protein
VHDVIANGRDACERSGFPPGEVLKGHLPPCVKKERLTAVPAFLSAAPPPPVSLPYVLGMCPSAAPGLSGTEKGMAAISLSSSSRELVCNEAW